MTYDAVLFDLDGTLVDTAPDMVAVLLDIQKSEGKAPLAYSLARNYVSHGAAGLVGLGFPDASKDQLERLRIEFLDRYEKEVCNHSTLFPGLAVLLDRFDAAGIPWGIVTNKPERMTSPLLISLGIAGRSASTVSGDTIPERKPDPAPLLLACEQAGVVPERVIYVGDAARDIEAGRAAGMYTIAATYGYITDDDDPAAWNAHVIAADTEELTHLLLKAVNLAA
jgi:phosphoglycolate phosphatase